MHWRNGQQSHGNLELQTVLLGCFMETILLPARRMLRSMSTDTGVRPVPCYESNLLSLLTDVCGLVISIL